MLRFETKQLPLEASHIAPDGSEIRELCVTRNGGLAHCTLPVGAVSTAHTHKSVEEIWYFIQGQGEVWRHLEGQRAEKPVAVHAGICLTIPVGTHFQFRNTGKEPLLFIISTMPPWPGPDEAVRVEDYWKQEDV